MSKEIEIQLHIQETLKELFGFTDDQITPDAKLYEDLGLDSIDAIDLVVRLGDYVGKRIDGDAFRKVRTVQDLYDTVAEVLKAA